MATRAKPWADAPFPLIETPSVTMDVKAHAAIHCASEMSHAHNVLIRGLNSIYQQAPYVRKPADIKDFLFFCVAWVKTVEHHHDTEENTMFPALQKFTQRPDIMAVNMKQHEVFLPGLHSMQVYATSTSSEAYSWESLKAIIDGFAPALMTHLREEIPTLLGLDGYDSAELMKLWLETEETAKGAAHPNQFVSLIAGSQFELALLVGSED